MLSVSENQVAITGVAPPQDREAIIRVAWPSVASHPMVATLGRKTILSYVLAPIGWALMLPFYFLKVLPGLGTRYTLTNRRLMIRRGLNAKTPAAEIALSDIDDVVIRKDDNSHFFRAGNLEILSKGQVKLKLEGVPEPEAFKIAILNACMAWVPDAAKKWVQFIPAKAPDAK